MVTGRGSFLISAWRVRLALARAERGASAVEFAILAPLFFMIVFGMFSGGIVYFQRNNLVNAAREGARFGATLAVESFDAGCGGNSGTCWAENVRDVTVQRAYGDLSPAVTSRAICVALVTGSGGANNGTVVTISGKGTYYSWTGAGAPGSPQPCFNDGGADGGRRVQVMVRREGRINAVLFGMDVTIPGQASARTEQQPTGA